MSPTNDVWNDDTLQVNNHSEVNGSAHVLGFVDGYDVSISVISYEYEQGGETKMNHAPIVTVSAIDGKVVSEPYAHDSHDPHRAIENAKNTGEHVLENPETYID